MADVENGFAQARERLEDIVSQVRKKDVPLERSLDLLEEGVRLANACTEQIDQTEWRLVAEDAADSDPSALTDASSTPEASPARPEVPVDEAAEDSSANAPTEAAKP